MSRKKRVPEIARTPELAKTPFRFWPYALVALAALLAVLEVYAPALLGPFVFDDIYLPFAGSEFARAPLKVWLIGVRPLLMLTFWVNFKQSGLEPFPYHLFNVLIHFCSAALVFLAARRLLGQAGEPRSRREILAGFAGLVFLFHPLQTESVAYVASRSECLTGLLVLAAFTLFLYRRAAAVSWRVTAGVVLLFVAAATTKEHALALVPLLLLTDCFGNPGSAFQGLRRNWRLYGSLLVAGLAAGWVVVRTLKHSDTAGFAVKGLPWYEYFFTQCRAIWVYARLSILPYGQSADYDFPVSRTLLDHGAVLGLVALAGLTAAVIVCRRRYPLAAYGWLVFLVLLAPTSSLVPIADVLVERRMYLPLFGLLLVAVEFLRRWRGSEVKLAAGLCAVAVGAGALAYQRNQVWSSPVALWEDTSAKAPAKSRPHFQLATAYYEAGNCDDAVTEYETVARLTKPDMRLLADWGLAYDCLNQPERAIEKLRQAAALQPTAHLYSQIGMILAKQGRQPEALAALETAVRLDPNFAATYVYRGNIHASAERWQAAVADFQHALRLDPQLTSAASGLAMAMSRLPR